MLTRHALSAADLAGLKTATRLLVQRAGGIEAASAACRLHHGTLARHYSPSHPETMPADVVAALERAAGVYPITAALARLGGHALVPLSAEPGEPELLRQLGELMRRVGTACAAGAEAMDDGILTAAERALLSGELHEVVNTASAIMRWLAQTGAEESAEGGVG